MSNLESALMNAPDDRTLFIAESGEKICVGRIRAAAMDLASRLPKDAERLFIFTRSASAFCAGLLAANTMKRQLVLLPQGEADFRRDAGIDDACFLTDLSDDGVVIDLNAQCSQTLKVQGSTRLAFFTSGSSGAAKEIQRETSALSAEAIMWSERYAGQISHVAATVSHQHIYGLIFRVVTPIIAGWTSSDQAALSWEALGAQLNQTSLIVTSPAHLSRLPEKGAVPELKPIEVISSGGPLSWTAAKEATQLFDFAPTEILGSTETSGVARRKRQTENEPWTPIEDVQLSADHDGVLHVKSAFSGMDEPVPMGDRAQFLEDGRFVLKGRVDRILKVEGKRVSLSRVEKVFKSLEEVEDLVLLPTAHGQRERLSALVVLNDAGRLKLGEKGPFAYSRELIVSTGGLLAPSERPKRWRFVPDIPVNTQGKKVQRDLAALFDVERMLDLLKGAVVETEGSGSCVTFRVQNDLPWFEGHFENAPVLPGLAQVHLAVRLAEEIWSVRPASFNIARMKFQQVIRPNDFVKLSLLFDFQRRKLNYSLDGEKSRFSSATIG